MTEAAAAPTADFLPVARMRLTARAEAPLLLPAYAGSMLRGAFGHALLALSPLPHEDGKPCRLQATCPYCQLFATPPLPGHGLQKFSHMPQPYVIEPPEGGARQLRAGQSFSFGLVLVGKALNWLPLVRQAWQSALRTGLGAGLASCSLVEFKNENSPQRPPDKESLLSNQERKEVSIPNTQQLRLHFHTPLRLQVQGRPVRDARQLTARDLLIALARRHQLLCDVHLGPRAPQHNFADLSAQAQGIALQVGQMRWFDWGRYSQRQQQEMKLGGLLGSLTLRGNLALFADLLYLGQWLHVGKNASFGLGGYTLDTASTEPAHAPDAPPPHRPGPPAHQN